MLIYAAIVLADGRSVAAPGIAESKFSYPHDPISMARLLRRENARALHVFDLDAARKGAPGNRGIVGVMTRDRHIQIPIQYAGGVRSLEDARGLLGEVGVSRVVLDPGASDDYELLEDLAAEFDASSFAAHMRVRPPSSAGKPLAADDFAGPARRFNRMSGLGIRRVLYTDINAEERDCAADFDVAIEFAETFELTVTLNGGVRNRDDLRRLESRACPYVDSVVLAEPLYSDAFPCQGLWRVAERAAFVRNSDDQG